MLILILMRDYNYGFMDWCNYNGISDEHLIYSSCFIFLNREESKNINFDTNLFAICFLDTDTYYIDDQYYWRIFNISCLATNSISRVFHDCINGIY